MQYDRKTVREDLIAHLNDEALVGRLMAEIERGEHAVIIASLSCQNSIRLLANRHEEKGFYVNTISNLKDALEHAQSVREAVRRLEDVLRALAALGALKQVPTRFDSLLRG